MKNKFTFFYSIFAVLIFIFSISFFAFNLYKEYSYGEARTSNTFNTIKSEIKNKSNVSDPNTLIREMNILFDDYKDFAYIKISLDNKDLLQYPANATQQLESSKLSKKYKASISTKDGNYYIDSDLYILRPYSIFYFAKISFLIILIVTIITIILIIYINMTLSQSTISNIDEETDEPVPTENLTNTEIVQVETVQTINNNNEISDKNSQEKEPEISTESTASDTSISDISSSQSNTEEPVLNNSSEVESTSENTTEENTVPETKTVELPSEEIKPAKMETNIDNAERPEGLFNPETGFGWQEYLITRLDSEINRAIASEIDLSLFIFQLPGLERTSDYIKNVCNYLSIQFQFKDLLFEYKDDCLVAMKISMDIDEAISFADKLYLDIKNILQEKECFIGISTRSIRMVSGTRLLNEAEQASLHAKEDKDSPIIAFRVDAEKYRQYLENKD